MTDNLPDYTAIEPPDGKAPSEYTTHERRAEILQVLIQSGSPYSVKQYQLGDRYDVHESTISRDMDRLRESIGENLGRDAKLTTRTVFEKTVRELQSNDEWKEAWDVVMDWNDWLGDIGEQYREPDRSKLDVDMDSRHAEVAYTVVREGDDEPLPTTDDGDPDGDSSVDYEALGFTAAPADIDVTATDSLEDEDGRGDRDE